jgi:hypothetical protein
MDKWIKWLLIIAIAIVVIFVLLPVIVIVLASLVFLIQPSQAGANTCAPTAGILITNHNVNSGADDISLMLSNQTGEDLRDVDVEVNGTIGKTLTSGADNISGLGVASQTETFSLLPAFNAGESYSLSVKFSYTGQDGLSREITSTCIGKVS